MELCRYAGPSFVDIGFPSQAARATTAGQHCLFQQQNNMHPLDGEGSPLRECIGLCGQGERDIGSCQGLLDFAASRLEGPRDCVLELHPTPLPKAAHVDHLDAVDEACASERASRNVNSQSKRLFRQAWCVDPPGTYIKGGRHGGSLQFPVSFQLNSNSQLQPRPSIPLSVACSFTHSSLKEGS